MPTGIRRSEHSRCRSITAYRLFSVIAVLGVFLASHTTAQWLPPRMEPYQMVDSLLPVFDDYGEVIPERLIQSRTTTRIGARIGVGVLGALAGAAIGYALSTPEGDPDCSIYEPCSDREKYYMSVLPPLGALLGFLLTAVVPDYEIDRFDAIEVIRRERRARRGGIRP